MKYFLIIVLYWFSLSLLFSQEHNISEYWDGDNKIYEANIYKRDHLLEKIKYEISYNSDHLDFYFIEYTNTNYANQKIRTYSYSWGLRKNAFILLLFDIHVGDTHELKERVVLNADIESMQNISSVYSVSRANGYEKKYQPGEYYYDFPADPDSIFNTIPKELGLPDTLLHIKYKQPWME
jgi:hypothetical protein